MSEITRRQVLRTVLVTASGAVTTAALAACGADEVPAPTATQETTNAPAATQAVTPAAAPTQAAVTAAVSSG